MAKIYKSLIQLYLKAHVKISPGIQVQLGGLHINKKKLALLKDVLQYYLPLVNWSLQVVMVNNQGIIQQHKIVATRYLFSPTHNKAEITYL